MATYIRLTDYKSSDEKEQEFFNPENRYEAKQEDFSKIPGSPIGYWISETIRNIFVRGQKLSSMAEPRQGMATADNDRFVRFWNEVSFDKVGLGFSDRDEAKNSMLKWFPYNKGGEYKKWYGNNELLVNWENDGHELFDFKPKSVIRNPNYYFQKGITWSLTSSGSSFAARYKDTGFLFDVNGMSIFPSDNNILYINSFMCSKITYNILQLINPTMAYQVGDIAKLPIIFPKSNEIQKQIETLTQQNIDISKEEWDSRETSWNFTASPLLMENGELKIENEKVEDAYNCYCDYWREKFYQLHKNEEELNRLFIDIYELQDELTPDVELKDITILKNEAKIEDGELVFQADEIMKQFISYGIGVMFGRYSLDHDGLHVANMNESLEQANSKFSIENSTFEADDDNIIPVLEDDYFKDDIASRFVQFVKTTFGEEDLSENIQFIESSLGTTLRKYFVKDFYEDHIKRYKKRPIYWMVASPKKGFMSLIYMHRYKADTFARVRNSYLTEYIAKLEAHKETLALTTSSDTASDKDKKDADKQMKNIEIKLKEIIEFDRDKMMSFAQKSFEIDLDDGVKVNYCRFKEILYPIKGLCK